MSTLSAADQGSAIAKQLSQESTPVTKSRVLEFVLVGGSTLLLLPLLWLSRTLWGLERSELVVGFLTFHAALVINDPHFAVTYLLFYRRVKQRLFGGEFSGLQWLRYLAAGVLVPLALVAWLALALGEHAGEKMGWLLQLMFFLVSWHYVKQGYGVLMVLSARAGYRFLPRERGALLLHSYAGWAYAFSSPARPATEYVEHGAVFTVFAKPQWLSHLTLALALGSLAYVVWLLAQRWRLRRESPPLSAFAIYGVSIWIWTIFTELDPLMMYAIPGLHSLQYLYFVYLLRRPIEGSGGLSAMDRTTPVESEVEPMSFRAGAFRLASLLGAAVCLGWLLLKGLPAFLDQHLVLKDPLSKLGPTPYLAGFVAFVNIHHYFMDSVIWRRDNPETSRLLL